MEKLTNWTEWEYKTEGNRNILFKYIGTNPSFRNKLLRINKDKYSDNYFIKMLEIHSLLPEKYRISLDFHSVTEDFLFNLNINSFHQRPEYRRHHFINLLSDTALILDDISSLSELSFEIKPKWAFLQENRSCCRYCIHQIHKLSNRKINRISSFCPLDLFSGKKDRINKSLHSLFLDKQNNLKIFFHGKELDTVPIEYKSNEICEILTNIFLTDNILQIIKNIQLSTHKDISHIHSIYSQLKINDLEKNNNKISNELRLISEYLLSVTFKDVSIFITLDFNKRFNKNEDSIYFRGQKIFYIIKLIDLDPKFSHSIPKYFKLEELLGNISTSKICKE